LRLGAEGASDADGGSSGNIESVVASRIRVFVDHVDLLAGMVFLLTRYWRTERLGTCETSLLRNSGFLL
jgi:hypothetical protein